MELKSRLEKMEGVGIGEIVKLKNIQEGQSNVQAETPMEGSCR